MGRREPVERRSRPMRGRAEPPAPPGPETAEVWMCPPSCQYALLRWGLPGERIPFVSSCEDFVKLAHYPFNAFVVYRNGFGISTGFCKTGFSSEHSLLHARSGREPYAPIRQRDRRPSSFFNAIARDRLKAMKRMDSRSLRMVRPNGPGSVRTNSRSCNRTKSWTKK